MGLCLSVSTGMDIKDMKNTCKTQAARSSLHCHSDLFTLLHQAAANHLLFVYVNIDIDLGTMTSLAS